MKKHLIYFVSILIFSIILCGAASAGNIPVNNITGIQNAINTAHDGDTLNLTAGIYKEHDITVNKNLTITGPQTTGNNQPTAVVDAQQQGRVFKIVSGVNVTLKYLLIRNGNATSNHGGGIYNEGTLTVTNSNVNNNTATGEYGTGAGIYNSGNCNVTSSNINNNTAENDGAGIYNSGNCNVTSSNISNNNAGNDGAGIYNSGNCNVTSSNISNNNAGNDGAGIYNSGNCNVTSSNISNNNAGNDGGGMKNWESNCTVTNSNISNNTAGNNGAGIYDSGFSVVTIIVTNSNISNNTAENDGGGIYTSFGTFTVTNTNINNNTAENDGGGIYIFTSTCILTSSNINNNTAGNYGGAIYNYGESTTVTLNFCRIFGNSASTGSAIYGDSGYVNATLNWWGSDSDPSSQVYGAVDVTPWLVYNPAPTVTAVDPASSAVNVLPNKVITVTFSQPIKIGTGWIELKNSSETSIPITTSINGYVLTINHTALLTNGKYTLALHTGSLTNLAGNNINAYTTSFTVNTPLTITSTDPVNNAVNVPRNKAITITFSEPIKAGNMWIELYNTTGTKTPIPITTSISGNVLTINHTALLANGTKYILAFHTGSITDNAGNPIASTVRYFTTSTDNTAPTITSTDPINNAVNVARDKVITVTFSEVIKAGTMWIELYNTVGTKTLIPITTSFSGNVLTINHTALLANGTKYTLAFHTGSITDMAGNSLTGVARYFTTSTDNTAPTITSTDPVNNAVNVPRNKAITITFSEPIKAGTMWIELYNTTGTKTPIPITTTISGNTLTINHSTLLANGTKYTLAFHTGSITDLTGNNLGGVARYFTTSTDTTAPTITSTDPTNNAINIARNKVIKITFSESLKWGNFWIELKTSSGTLITITKSITSNFLTITHSALLAPNTKYTIALHSGCVTDYAGNPLVGVVRTFTAGIT